MTRLRGESGDCGCLDNGQQNHPSLTEGMSSGVSQHNEVNAIHIYVNVLHQGLQEKSC